MNKQDTRISQIRLMLNLQDKLNTIVNPTWRIANQDWLRASWIEAAELMDYCDWKWWKHQKFNKDQAHIELSDIFHFLLSHYIVQYNYQYSDDKNNNFHYTLERAILQSYEKSWEYKNKLIINNEKSKSGLYYIETFVYNLFHQKNDHDFNQDILISFYDICYSLDLSFDKLYEMYIAKNVLNIFRQDHGYKEGTYIKQWPSPLDHGTVEDNVYLETIMNEEGTKLLVSQEPDKLFDFVYNRLEQNYPSI